jgi:hypothetical protein
MADAASDTAAPAGVWAVRVLGRLAGDPVVRYLCCAVDEADMHRMAGHLPASTRTGSGYGFHAIASWPPEAKDMTPGTRLVLTDARWDELVPTHPVSPA